MRSASKVVAAAAPLPAEGEPVDAAKVHRHRKTSRSQAPSITSISSAASSDAEPSSPGRTGRTCSATPARHAVVIDHQGAGKVVHQPDGTVVWEPSPQAASGGAPPPPVLWSLLEVGALVFGTTVTMVGFITTMENTTGAAAVSAPRCLTRRQLTAAVANAVTGYVAGTATGVVLGPLVAARCLAGVLLRPALLGLAAHAGIRALGRWRSGVLRLLRQLQSGDPAKLLEALRAIIAAARRNPKFAREFNKLAGIEALLQTLAAAAPDCPLLHLIAQALAELCKDPDCRESLVAAGGVPRLVSLLQHTQPGVAAPALAALGTLADNALAQEAIREAGGLGRLVELAAAAVAPAPPPAAGLGTAPAAASAAPAAATDKRVMLLPAVQLLQALSLDPASKAAIGAAGGVPALLDVVSRSEPRSVAQSAAIAALHNALRGSPDNQRALAALPAASEVLRAALAGFGPCYAPPKADLHALLNVLARLQGVQEAGGFVVVQSQVAAAAGREGAAAATAPAAAAARA